ncbi:MAG: two-component system sensor histidine kinase NtrB [Thermodesulfobacteriota bacterium]
MSPSPGGGTSVSHDVLRGRLYWLMFLRVVVVTFLLGATVLLQVRETRNLLTSPLIGLYGLIGIIYFLTLIYIFLMKRVPSLKGMAYAQIVVDILGSTALVYLTGLEESVFSSIYNLSIITGSILLYRQGGLTTASLSAFLYGGLLDLRYYEVISPLALGSHKTVTSAGSELFYTILVNISAFFIVALLSSYLAEQARKSQQELKETKSDLSRLTAIHENILRCLHSGLLTTDLHGKVQYANRAAEEITGVPAMEIVGKEVFHLFSELMPGLLKDADDDTSPLEDRRRTMTYQRPDGTKIHLGFSLAPLRSADGTKIGTIIHFQDLTQTISMEEHLRRVDRLATVGEMAARLAHEIRNPLASLSGSIQLLQDELSLDGANRRLMEIVTQETQRLNALLTDFLLFAKPERPSLQPLDLSCALRETLDLIADQRRQGASVRVVSQITPGLTVEADPKKISQVIWNLLNNALEAMPGGGELRVRARKASRSRGTEAPRENSWVHLEIEDTGVGIPRELQARIFDPFFTTKDRGTGLGLSTVHRTLEGMGGMIEVHSEPGRGARFSVWLPCRPGTGSDRGLASR